MKVRVLTFNTLFHGDVHSRMGVLADLLENSDYDIVCLQEVISPMILARLRRRTGSYPHAAFTWTFPRIPRPEHLAVMGDFNVPRDSPYFRDFASTTGLKDALAGDTTPPIAPNTPTWAP